MRSFLRANLLKCNPIRATETDLEASVPHETHWAYQIDSLSAKIFHLDVHRKAVA